MIVVERAAAHQVRSGSFSSNPKPVTRRSTLISLFSRSISPSGMRAIPKTPEEGFHKSEPSTSSYAILISHMRVDQASIPATPVYPDLVKKKAPPELRFHERLVSLRKERGLTPQAVAELVSMQIPQIRPYESGQSQPTLDAIRKLAVAPSVSADMLLFEKDERGPDEDLKLQFEAASRLDPEEKNVIRSAIESIMFRNTVRAAERRFIPADSGGNSRQPGCFGR